MLRFEFASMLSDMQISLPCVCVCVCVCVCFCHRKETLQPGELDALNPTEKLTNRDNIEEGKLCLLVAHRYTCIICLLMHLIYLLIVAY